MEQIGSIKPELDSTRPEVVGSSTMAGRYVVEALRDELPEGRLVVFCIPAGDGKEVDEAVGDLVAKLSAAPPKWLVMVGSAEAYGLQEGEGIDEQTPPRGDTSRSRAIARAERLLSERCEEWQTVLTILRPAMMLGSGYEENEHLRRMFADVRSGRWFSVRGRDAAKSLVCAYDVARIVKALYRRGGIYNVADGCDRPLSYLAAAMSENIGESKRPWVVPEKWAAAFVKLFPKSRLGGEKLMDILDYRTSPLTFSTKSLEEATGLKMFDTVDVVARRCLDYPYETGGK